MAQVAGPDVTLAAVGQISDSFPGPPSHVLGPVYSLHEAPPTDHAAKSGEASKLVTRSGSLSLSSNVLNEE
jgi:hypothetical protein